MKLSNNTIGAILGGSAMGLLGITLVVLAIQRSGTSKAQAETVETEAEEAPKPKTKATTTASQEAPSPQPTASSDPVQQYMAQLAAIKDPIEAIKFAGPKDTIDDPDKGTIAFAIWSSDHLKWEHVNVSSNETSAAKVMKDPEAERGKRACWSGRIVQISVDRSVKDPIYLGVLGSGANAIKFIAARSTGDLVERSSARFCGFVMGRYSYQNVSGGQTHSVSAVGVFDLPENKSDDARPPAAGHQQRSAEPSPPSYRPPAVVPPPANGNGESL